LRGHERGVSSAAFSPEGRRILTVSWDRTARLWDAATGTETAQIILDAGITAVALQDGCIFAGDALGRIHTFDVEEFL
jgi:WD40 repeat protein